MNGCMHANSNVAKLYLPRKVVGEDLSRIEECVEKKKKALHAYIEESNECMLKAAKNEKVLDEEESLMDSKKRTYKEKKRNWKEKALHGEFTRQTAEIGTDEYGDG